MIPNERQPLYVEPDEQMRARLKRCKSGCVLLARDTLKDPNFDNTVVLICVHNTDGAYGLVVNRPSHMPLSELFDGFSDRDRKRTIFIGGPVRQEALQIVQVTDTPVPNALQIAPRVFQGGDWADVNTLLATDDRSSRLFLGYSGWSPGQLEFEIMAGAWEVFDLDVERMLIEPEQSLMGDAEGVERFLRSISRNWTADPAGLDQ